MQKPSPGRIVIAAVDPSMNNGSDEAPAIITRVWDEHPNGGWVVNLRVFVDTLATPLSLTSVRLFDAPGSTIRPGAAWWPPRV